MGHTVDMTWEIFTHGSGDILAQFLEGTKMIMANTESLQLLLLLMGFLWVFVGALLAPGNAAPLHMISTPAKIMAVILTYFVVVVPTADVAINDQFDSTQNGTVTDVPLVLAGTGAVTSQIGQYLTELVEEVMTPVNTSLTNGPVATARALEGSTKVMMPKSIQQRLNVFLRDCVVHNLADPTNFHNWNTTDDLLDHMATYRNSAIYLYYINNAGTEVFATCSDLYDVISNEISTSYDSEILPYFAKSIRIGVDVVEENIGNAYTNIAAASNGAKEILINHSIANQYDQAFIDFCTIHGVSDVALVSVARAEAQLVQETSWLMGSFMSRQLLPEMWSYFELLGFALFPIWLLFSMISFKILLSGIGYFAWLSSWQPGYAVVNAISEQRLQEAFSSLVNSPYVAGSAGAMADVAETAMQAAQYANFMFTMVPVIAGMVIFGGSAAIIKFGGVSDSDAGVKRASWGGADTATLGNVNWANTNLGKHSANKYDDLHQTKSQGPSGIIYETNGIPNKPGTFTRETEVSGGMSTERTVQGGLGGVPVQETSNYGEGGGRVGQTATLTYSQAAARTQSAQTEYAKALDVLTSAQQSFMSSTTGQEARQRMYQDTLANYQKLDRGEAVNLTETQQIAQKTVDTVAKNHGWSAAKKADVASHIEQAMAMSWGPNKIPLVGKAIEAFGFAGNVSVGEGRRSTHTLSAQDQSELKKSFQAQLDKSKGSGLSREQTTSGGTGDSSTTGQTQSTGYTMTQAAARQHTGLRSATEKFQESEKAVEAAQASQTHGATTSTDTMSLVKGAMQNPRAQRQIAQSTAENEERKRDFTAVTGKTPEQSLQNGTFQHDYHEMVLRSLQDGKYPTAAKALAALGTPTAVAAAMSVRQSQGDAVQMRFNGIEEGVTNGRESTEKQVPRFGSIQGRAEGKLNKYDSETPKDGSIPTKAQLLGGTQAPVNKAFEQYTEEHGKDKTGREAEHEQTGKQTAATATKEMNDFTPVRVNTNHVGNAVNVLGTNIGLGPLFGGSSTGKPPEAKSAGAGNTEKQPMPPPPGASPSK